MKFLFIVSVRIRDEKLEILCWFYVKTAFENMTDKFVSGDRYLSETLGPHCPQDEGARTAPPATTMIPLQRHSYYRDSSYVTELDVKETEKR